jgi:hypothetical protein
VTAKEMRTLDAVAPRRLGFTSSPITVPTSWGDGGRGRRSGPRSFGTEHGSIPRSARGALHSCAIFSTKAAAIEGILFFLKSAIEAPSNDLILIAIEQSTRETEIRGKSDLAHRAACAVSGLSSRDSKNEDTSDKSAAANHESAQTRRGHAGNFTRSRILPVIVVAVNPPSCGWRSARTLCSGRMVGWTR